MPSGSSTLTFTRDVKVRRRGSTTISSKNQITIPVAELRAAGLAVGDRLVARADGAGRIVLRLPDALVLATAAATFADRLVTTDRRWPTPRRLGVPFSLTVL